MACAVEAPWRAGREIMVAAANDLRRPLALAVSGEAEDWLPAVEAIVGQRYLITYRVQRDWELIEVVREGLADAAVLDEEVHWPLSAMQVLRIVRRVRPALPVVMLARQPDRRWLEDALRLGDHTLFVGRVLAVEAESDSFDETWLVGDPDYRPLHYLGLDRYAALGERFQAVLRTTEEGAIELAETPEERERREEEEARERERAEREGEPG